jgi:hypothetical protein
VVQAGLPLALGPLRNLNPGLSGNSLKCSVSALSARKCKKVGRSPVYCSAECRSGRVVLCAWCVVRWSHVHLGVGADERMEIVVDSLGLLLMEVVSPFWCS